MRESLGSWLSGQGFDFEPILDGEIHRFKPNGRKGKDGWYCGGVKNLSSGRMVRSITVEDFASGNGRCNFNEITGGNSLSTEEKAEIKLRNEELKIRADKKRKEENEKAKKTAEEICQNATKAREDNPYLQRKKIGLAASWIKEFQGDIIVPVEDWGVKDGRELVGVQRIKPDGTKLFIPGTKKSGNCYLIYGNLEGGLCDLAKSPVIGIAEGFATATTIYLATGWPVFVAFDAYNLKQVCTKISGLLYNKAPSTKTNEDTSSTQKIIIFGDDDKYGDNNVGRASAIEAAKLTGLLSAFPTFTDESTKPTDWNDLHVLEGLDAVKIQVDRIIAAGDEKSRDHDSGIPEVDVEEGEPGAKGDETKKKKSLEKILDEQEAAKANDRINANKQKLVKRILDIRYKLQVESGQSVLYKITNIQKKEVCVCQNTEEALRRLHSNLTEITGKVYTPKNVKMFYDLWRLSTDALNEKPKPFSWAKDHDWCFKKLEFNPVKGEYPAWEQFLARLSSKEDFMAFVWSIFEIKNKSRQYLYLSDPVGESGKSTVIKVLGWVFGDSFTAISNSTIAGGNSRWLMGQLYGKRLVAWPDCKNPKFCMSETVRNFTSGDSVVVEFKGESPFATEMYLKFIIGSNHEPQITSGGADTSRLIHIQVKENTDKKDDPEWADRLKKELPFFLYDCMQLYKEKCPNHGKILLSEDTHELVKNADEDLESPFEAICEDRISFEKGAETGVSEWVRLCKDSRLSNFEVGNFKEYLKRNHGVKIFRTRDNGKKITKYLGFKIINKDVKDTMEWMNKN